MRFSTYSRENECQGGDLCDAISLHYTRDRRTLLLKNNRKAKRKRTGLIPVRLDSFWSKRLHHRDGSSGSYRLVSHHTLVSLFEDVRKRRFFGYLDISDRCVGNKSVPTDRKH